MKCPVCTTAMVEEDFGGIVVDVCRDGCRGIWFDWAELVKLDEPTEGLGAALKQALDDPRQADETRGDLTCPKCGIPMHAHRYSFAKGVTVDECYVCGGFFLDAGELSAIREHFMSEQEIEDYTKELLKNIPEYQQARRELEKDKQRAEAARRLTRFVRLSYYMTGK